MKKTTKDKPLAIKAIFDYENDEVELQYSSSTQKKFARALLLVKSIEKQLCPTNEEMDREETFTALEALGLAQIALISAYQVIDIVDLLALAILDRKKLQKAIGPLRSVMQALANLPCVAAIPVDVPPAKRLFLRKDRNWNTYEKIRAATRAKPQFTSTEDSRLLLKAMEKLKRSRPGLKLLKTVLWGSSAMYNAALRASRGG